MSGTWGRSRCVFTALVLLLVVSGSASAAGLLVPRDGSPPITVRSHRVTAVLENGLARTTLRQTFVNPYARSLEAIYVFPLPESAALVDVAMEVGGQRLEGLLVERSRARKIYDEIVSSRRDPAIVEKIARGKFRLSVFPVVPRVATVVEITWIEQVPLAQGSYRYVYPLSLAGSAAKTRQDFSFSLRIDSAIPIVSVTSPDSKMKIKAEEKNAVASFERHGAKLDRDIVIEAAVEVPQPTLSVESFRLDKGPGYFLAIVTPPKATADLMIPRDVIVVLDTSGSMRGDKLAQAKKSAVHLINGLRDVDRVNVIRFSSDVESFADAPVPAFEENRKKLRAFVAKLEAGGGTRLGDAVSRAVDYPPAEGRVRSVVLLTDGCPTLGVTDASRIVTMAREGGKKGFRVFTFGVGDDVNPALLEGISQASAGASELIKPADELKSRLNQFLVRSASPLIADIKVTVDGTKVYDMFPRPLPDAYLGEQVVVAGRYRDGGKHEVSVSARIGTVKTELHKVAHFRVGEGGRRSAMQLFAAKKLAYLEGMMRLRTGLSDEAFFAAVDRGQYDSKDEIIDEMIRTSLDCGVQCAYTAFLVLLPEDRWRIDPADEEALADAKKRAAKAKDDAVAKKADAPDGPGGTAAGSNELPPKEPDTGNDTPSAPPPPPPPAPGEQEAEPNTGPDQEPPPPDRHANDPPPAGESEGGGEEGGGEGSGGAEEEEREPGDGGQGGSHRGPAGGVPPGERSEDDPQPPPEDEGSGTPPGEPNAGNPGTTPPPPPPAGGSPLGKSPGGAMAPGGRKRSTTNQITFEHWLFWWGYNRDRITAQVAGRDPDRAHVAADPVTLATLRSYAKSRTVGNPVRAAALLALARAGGPTERPILIEALRTGDREVAIAAALGLAVTGEPGPIVRKALLAASRNASKNLRVRLAALMAIGLMRDDSPEVILELLRVLEAEDGQSEIRAAALFAIGLIGDEGFVPRLSEWLRSGRIGRRRANDYDCAWIVDTLGRIGHPRALPLLVDSLRKKSRYLRRSAAIAIGRVVPNLDRDGQAKHAKLLFRYVLTEDDVTARNFAVIALGRIAAAEETYPDVRDGIVRFLRKDYREANKFTERPFTALALGLAAPALSTHHREQVCDLLRNSLVEMKGDRTALGANAVALGLAGDRSLETVSLLRNYLADTGQNSRLQAAAANALGLLGDVGAVPDLTAMVRLRKAEDLTVAAAGATALIRDLSTVEPLLSMIVMRNQTAAEGTAVASALGRMRDPAAGPALLRVLTDPNQGRRRVYAAQALGQLFARPDTIPLYRLTTDVNYRSLGKHLGVILTWE